MKLKKNKDGEADTGRRYPDKRLIWVVMALLLICLAVSSIKIIGWVKDRRIMKEEYGDVLSDFTDDEPTDPQPGEDDPVDPQEDTAQEDTRKYSPEWLDAKEQFGFAQLPEISLKKMRTRNKDVFGWICIPDSPVNYPLLQGQDNTYYLTHSYKKHETVAGSIMLDCQCSNKMTDPYSLVWGHRVRDGSMFGKLDTIYGSEAEAEAHKYLYIILKDGTIRVYEFCSYTTGETPGLMMDFKLSYSQWMPKIVDFINNNNNINFGADASADDRLISLACCLKRNTADKRNFFTFREIYNGPYLLE